MSANPNMKRTSRSWSSLTPTHRYRLLKKGITEREYDGSVDDKWIDQAACRGMDTDLFFPVTADSMPRTARQLSTLRRNTRAAAAVCERCPVSQECLDYGLRTRSTGVFGGHYLHVNTSKPLPLTPC